KMASEPCQKLCGTAGSLPASPGRRNQAALTCLCNVLAISSAESSNCFTVLVKGRSTSDSMTCTGRVLSYQQRDFMFDIENPKHHSRTCGLRTLVVKWDTTLAASGWWVSLPNTSPSQSR